MIVAALIAILFFGVYVIGFALERLARKIPKIARLHVTLQFELSTWQWDEAEADITELERIGGSWDAFSYMVRQTIAAGREQRITPPDPMAGKRFDEETQSYVTDN